MTILLSFSLFVLYKSLWDLRPVLSLHAATEGRSDRARVAAVRQHGVRRLARTPLSASRLETSRDRRLVSLPRPQPAAQEAALPFAVYIRVVARLRPAVRPLVTLVMAAVRYGLTDPQLASAFWLVARRLRRILSTPLFCAVRPLCGTLDSAGRPVGLAGLQIGRKPRAPEMRARHPLPLPYRPAQRPPESAPRYLPRPAGPLAAPVLARLPCPLAATDPRGA